jgi:hypothetical protein
VTDHDPDRFEPLEPFEQPRVATPHHTNPRWIVAIVGVVAVAIGVWIVAARLPGWLTRPPSGAVIENTATVADGEARRIQATLFYVSNDGTTLVPTSRDVLYGATPVEQVRRLVEAQVDPPPDGLVSAIAPGTTVRAVFLTDARDAYVDLGGDVVNGHSGGSLDEALAVYAIVNAITVNLPEVRAVQILIEGREVDSLRGHLDLRAPLSRANDWIQKGPSPP